MRAPVAQLVAGAIASGALCTTGAPCAHAEEEVVPPLWTPSPNAPPPFTIQLSSAVGEGLRFNNPFRLATPLGEDAESVSRTAVYLDLGAAMLFGDPRQLQHGGALRVSVSMEGVPQAVVAPSYMLYRRWRSLAAWGRAGLPIVSAPETTLGFEAAGGAAWFFLAGVGVAGEVVGDLFYGAATREVARAAYPLISAQLGLVIAYEVLP